MELLRQGLTAEQVLKRLLEEDSFERKEGRQVAIVDAKGNIAVLTGPAASEWKGHVQRRHFSVQGNILVGPQVLDSMARAFELAEGDLAERLYAALKAGDDAGGDSRGRQSATLKVVRKGGGVNINNDRFADVHVQDHPQPLTELRRLLNLQLATTYGGERARQVAAGDIKKALAAAEREATYSASPAGVALGLLRYLNGNKTGAVEALRRGRQIAPDFKERWDAAMQIPIFKRVLEDSQFVADVMR